MPDLLKYTFTNGRTVLGKMYKDDVFPVMYTNYTQANKKAAELNAAGVKAAVLRPSLFGRSIYVEIQG
jgi:hypothetical protein